jgi:hypothetical protein
MPRFLLPLVFVSLLPSLSAGDEVWRPALAGPDRLKPLPTHYIVQAEHVLRPEEQAQLAAEGVEVQHFLPGNRYVVRTTNRDSLDADPRLQSVATIAPSKKLHPTAYADVARGRAFARLRLLFHDDVSFEDAQRAIETVGGFVERPLAVDFDVPHGLQARIPSTSLSRLAADDRIFAIYGGPLRPATDNAQAAALSHVTELYSAPYNLSGNGVAVSLFELAAADTTHPEFGGRLTAHFTGGTSDDAVHATHVSGTIIASGIDPMAKGMAPAATLHEFSATTDTAVWMSDKQNTLPSLGVVADNNSWGFQLGWQEGVSGAPSQTAWYGAIEYFGGYDGFYSAPYDKIARNGPVIFVHSAGNDASNGYPSLPPWSPHGHVNDNGDLIKNEIFCYSQNGSGTDCPLPTCTAGVSHCEITKHPTYGPFRTMGVLASTKNAIAVGAVDVNGQIAFFSSRGPTRDGRVKPDIVAKGVSQYSTVPNNLYRRLQGTSMSSPVITGISAMLTEQWRKTFGQSPTPEMLKTVLIAGADDLGNPGPDWTYGFGLADAKASVDLILADNNTGRRIRTASASQGQQIETSLTLSSPQNVRVVLGWADPEVLLVADPVTDELAGKTLVNDLDLKVIDPSGNTILPYVLDPNDPCITSDGTIACKPATRGVNTVDNTEEVEIANAAAGTYRVMVNGTSIASGSSQPYVLIANALLGTVTVCTDSYGPNGTPDTAFGNLPTGTSLNTRFCAQSDVDYFKFAVTDVGTVSVTVTATDTPVKVTLLANGVAVGTKTIAAGGSDSISVAVTSSTAYLVRLEPAGTIGANAGYTLTVRYPFTVPLRRRTSHH